MTPVKTILAILNDAGELEFMELLTRLTQNPEFPIKRENVGAHTHMMQNSGLITRRPIVENADESRNADWALSITDAGRAVLNPTA